MEDYRMKRKALVGILLVCLVFLFVVGGYIAQPDKQWKKTFSFDYEEGTGWSEKQPLPTKKADATAATYDNKIYVFGGYNNTANDPRNETYEYDPSTNTWMQKANMPTARWGPIAVEYNGKIYVFGGDTDKAQTGSNKNEVYNPITNSWDTSQVAMPASISKQGLMGALYNDKIHLFYKQYHYEYDPINGSAILKNDVPISVTWGTCATVGNKIYLIGGHPTTNKVQILNVSADTWINGADMPDSLYGATRETSVINNKIYVTHGHAGSDFFATCYVYDPATDLWKEKSSGLYPRDGVACAVLKNKLYVIGGRADLVGPYGLDYNEEMDPALLETIQDLLWFEVVFAIAGLLAVAYFIMKKRKS